MSPLTEKYRNVIDVDFQSVSMDSYGADEWFRYASVRAELRLLELRGDTVRERSEKLKLTMIKDAGCKTQAVCGASVLKCRGCGAAISLMEGKTCEYCGRNLDLKLYDWVIAEYRIV